VKWKRWRLGLAGLVLAAATFPTLAAITINPWEPLFRGIEFTTGTADTNEVRQQKVFGLRVDLAQPTIEFFSTPSNGDAPLETFGQTTTTFVQTYGVAVGVNAGFFSPVNTTPNDPRDLTGLAISQGIVVSPHTSERAVLLITRSNTVTIAAAPPANYSNVWTAVAGSDLILVDGVVQLTNCNTSFCGPNPRTAVGLSHDGRYLYMMVIDGRQPGWSAGATLAETGSWLLRLGAWNGLNLDGGGSSAMAKSAGGTALLLNRPSGGTQRVDGNHLGVFAEPLP
jgi:exopolysaccharide biosynthesis protein